MKLKILCTICARKDSKGLKNKNFKKFLTTSLVNFTIKQAKKIKLFDKIVLSTDAKKHITQNLDKIDLIINRPKKLSNDFSSKIDTIKHALYKSELNFKETFDIIVDLDVTSPLRDLEDIKNCIRYFKKKNCDNLITGTLAKKNPFFNQAIIKKDFAYPVLKKKRIIKRRQSINNVYDLNAAIYVWKRKSLLQSNTVFMKKTLFYKMPQNKSIDIDTELDFKIVLWILKKNI